ncbi:MAG: M28 family metallopeptidase [Aureliella sp.]
MNENELRDRLFKHVDCLAGLIGPRHLGKPKTITATIGYITQQLTEMGYTVEQEHYDAMGQRATNLIAEVRGQRKPEEVVVVGAHYDTVFSTPGADDNASAVAVLIETARMMKAEHEPRGPKRTLRFVAFACEEPPYFNVGEMGSQHHARQSRLRGDKIVGMICLEMVGYFSDEPGSQAVPDTIPKFLHWLFPKRANFLVAVGNLNSIWLCWGFRRGFKKWGRRMPLFSICLPEIVKEIRLSDNSSFWDQGYPALMITDTSFLRNPHYHAATDTPETLNYEMMAKVALGVGGATRRLVG